MADCQRLLLLHVLPWARELYVKGLGFWAFRVLGSGFWVLGFWVQGFGFRVLGFGFWVQGSGYRFLGSRVEALNPEP